MSLAISSPAVPQIGVHRVSSLSWHCDDLTLEHCLSLRAEWEDIAAAASEPNVFQFPSFIRHSLPLLADLSPKIVTIREAGMLIGLVMLRRDTGYAKLPVPFWRTALHHEQYLGTPLVRAGLERAFATGLCNWLDQAPFDCCFIKLSMISADGMIARELRDHCKDDARRVLIANRFNRAAIAPPRSGSVSVDDLLRPSRRKSIRKSKKLLAKQGEVAIERLSDADQLTVWTDQFLAMEDTGWKHENRSSILSSKDETALYRAMIAEAFHARNLNFARLCLDGLPIAYTLDIAAPPFGFCLKSAIDQRYRKHSPGVLMEYETLNYYLGKSEFEMLDSCSAPDNSMLNEMWPDKKPVLDLAIARKGAGYSQIFRALQAAKALLNAGAGN